MAWRNLGATIPVVVEEMQATATERGILLAWKLSREAQRDLAAVRVQRADAAAGPFAPLGELVPAHEPEMSFLDPDVEWGRAYWYRLLLLGAGGRESIAGTWRLEAVYPARLRTALLPVQEAQGGGAVQIRYTVGWSPSPVRLDVYDMKGRRVRSFVEGARSPGQYLRTWDRRDESGARVSRSIYLVRLTAGPVRAARKLILVHE